MGSEQTGAPPDPSRAEGAWERTNVRVGGHRLGHRVHILVMGDDSRGLARALTEDMAAAFPNLCLDRIDGPDDLAHYDAGLGADDRVVLGLVTSEVRDIDAALDLVASRPILASTRWLVVTEETTHSDLSRSTTSGRLASVVSVPWTVPLLIGQSYSTMVRHLQAEGAGPERILELIGPAPANAVRGPLLEGLDLPEEEVVRRLLEGVERVLGRRPRLVIPSGTELAVQGEPVRAVHLVLAGDVSLHRDNLRGEVLAHHATSGPLIGLVSLARGESAFFTAVTTSTARVVRLTHEQLEIALLEERALAVPLAALAIQSLTRRLMRAEDLHLENAMLAADLEAQREALESALADLRATRAELVEKARFAMLGELSAGIAHELNNPVTALARAAEHLGQDVERVLSTTDCLIAARDALRESLAAEPRSTSRERELVKDLLPALDGDRRLARRLVLAGVEDPARARQLAKAGEGELVLLESGARIGSSLRSVLAASERVVDLTRSLKGYARPEAAELQPVDVSAGIDDVLRLTGYRMRGIELVREGGPVSRVLAHPSKLQQVWTNLLVNAAEAIDDEREDVEARIAAGEDASPARGDDPARIEIGLSERAGSVLVEIADNGPGIPPEIVEKIFEPHFTTKAGRVRYGLGMGMSIVRSIVSDHGGELRVDSRPGATRMGVRLPALAEATPAAPPTPSAQPAEPEENR